MTVWTVGQLVDATGGELVTGSRDLPVSGIGIDSRRLEAGQAFVAIQGHRFDGHQFCAEAIRRGASALIVSRLPDYPAAIPTIRVPDTTKALGHLAAYHRRRFDIPLIAITGSCGKTTTKELLAHLLAGRCPVLKTQGTENNHIGLPLTLLRLTSSHEVVVVELGSNHPGEIAYLAEIAKPTIAVVTNVGPAHLEFFGSLERIRQEKLSLLEALDPHGIAIVTGDQIEVLLEAKAKLQPQATLLTFGISDQCGVQAIDIRRHPQGLLMRVRGVMGEFLVPLRGLHNVENVLAAFACLKTLGVPLETMQERLRQFHTLPMRSELVTCNGFTILNDCYNANPLSFARALETLRELDVSRKVVIAGDMLELGDYAPAAHQAIGRLAAQMGVDVLVAVGRFAGEVVKGASTITPNQTLTFHTVQELVRSLSSIVRNGDGILIKGSRRMNLEEVTAVLQKQARRAHLHDTFYKGHHHGSLLHGRPHR